MPRLVKALPKYRLHKPSGQAVVTLGGRPLYLGAHDTPASLVAYDRVIAEWLANGRRLFEPSEDALKIVDLVGAFWLHAQQHYVKNGRKTNEQKAMRKVLKYLRDLYGETEIPEFGPTALKAVRQKMIDAGNCRKFINQQVKRIRHVFKWGVSQELVPAETWHRLQAVAGLQAGKCAAPETEPVEAVEDQTVDTTLVHLPERVADMVKLQRLTGMRPGEVILLTPGDVDRGGAAWVYRPSEHKMEHKERGRLVFIGPQAQGILSRYLLRTERSAPCFVGTRGQPYTVPAYRKAIHRACEVAFGMPAELRKRKLTAEQKQAATAWRVKHCWDPNQLRHAAATMIRKRYGLEGSQVILGHAKADTTQIYAERDFEKAAAIALQVG